MLTNKYYAPILEILEYLQNKYNGNNKKILDIGPGRVPFKGSTHLIDICDWGIEYEVIKIDIDKDKIPFVDNYFDFVYCRHVLEDIQNPDFAYNEIVRVSKAFYIETPSPFTEISRGIDTEYTFNLYNNNLYRGYIHHKHVVNVNHNTNEIIFLPKFPCIEYINFGEVENKIKENILKNPIYWNSYYLCEDSKYAYNTKTYKHYVNFKLNEKDNYKNLLESQLNINLDSTNNFFNKYIFNK